jgi:NTE family protein
VWRGLHRDDVFPIDVRTLVGGLTNHRDHLVSDRGVRRLARRHLLIERLEDSPVPLHLVAYDALGGEEVGLAQGPALEALLVSSAIPGVLPPVERGERLLVDGDAVDNTPISHAVELGAERVYVMATADPLARGLPMPPRGALDAALHALVTLVGARLADGLVPYGDEAELIVLPAVNRHHIQPTDFDHASRLIGEAPSDARLVLDAAETVEAVAA